MRSWARFRSDGSFDLGFGTGGVAIRELSGIANATDEPHAIALDADGRIVLAGSVVLPGASSKLLLARFWP
jgi:hypothetical protein